MMLIDQAIAAHRAGNLDQAEALYCQILAGNGRDFDALHMMGLMFAQRGRFNDAERFLRDAMAIDDTVPPCLHHYANVLCRLGRYDEALPLYDKAIARVPNHAPLYSDRGNARRALGQLNEAIASYNKALALNPNFTGALGNLAQALMDAGRHEEAGEMVRRALALNPNDAYAIKLNAHMAFERGDLAAALGHARRTLSLKPDQADAYNTMGDALRDLGCLHEAREAYVKSIELDANKGAYYFALANCMTLDRSDRHFAAMESLAAKPSGLSKLDRMYLDFALGKANADVKDYRRSFRHLLAANAAKRATIAYDERSTFDFFERIEQIFSAQLIASKSGGGDPSRRPIFVLGMPRSGTTLVEQVLASHPAVHGAGELTTLGDVVMRAPWQGIGYPEYVPLLNQAATRAIGAEYLKRLAVLAPEGERVTDKMPLNYYFAGLVHLALPNAVIIHTVRDPIDTCVSCFSTLFKLHEQSHTYDLGEIGRYYVRYQRLMAHWRRVLPEGRILDVRYEDMVDDLEAQARRILAHCGLPWDERCLAFHRTDRPVRTASAAQVREPIYKKAVGRWRAYEEWLKPLLAELGTTETVAPIASSQSGAGGDGHRT